MLNTSVSLRTTWCSSPLSNAHERNKVCSLWSLAYAIQIILLAASRISSPILYDGLTSGNKILVRGHVHLPRAGRVRPDAANRLAKHDGRRLNKPPTERFVRDSNSNSNSTFVVGSRTKRRPNKPATIDFPEGVSRREREREGERKIENSSIASLSLRDNCVDVLICRPCGAGRKETKASGLQHAHALSMNRSGADEGCVKVEICSCSFPRFLVQTEMSQNWQRGHCTFGGTFEI